MRRVITVVGALTLVTGMMAAPRFSSAQAAPPWPTFHGGITRDGTSPVSGPTSEFALAKINLGNAVKDAPVVNASGRAFIGDDAGNVYAFDPGSPNNKPVWTASVGAPVRATPGLSPNGQTLYVGDDSWHVTAFNTATGAKVWGPIALQAPVHSSPVTSPDGSTVYLASINGTVAAVSAATGAQQWTVHVGGSIAGSITLSPDGTTLYVPTSISIVYAIPAAGSQAGQGSAPCYLDAPTSASPAVDQNGNVYVTTAAGSIFSFTPGCGAVRWGPVSVPTHAAYSTTPAITGNVVVAGNADGYVYGFAPSTGAQQWQFHTGGNVLSSAAIATGNGEVFVGSEDGHLYALTTSGQQTWANARVLGVGVGTPALAPDGSVWVASDDGVLYHFGNQPALPGNPPTATAGPSSTAGPTSTPSVPNATPTSSVLPLTFSLKATVKAGQKQTINVQSAPNTVVHFRVEYPNGDHQSHPVTTDASGAAAYTYTQGSSKVTHNKFTATVIATAGTGTAQNRQTQTYTIGWGKIDASAEPRAQRVGGKVQLWVHAKSGTHLRVTLRFPNGKTKQISGKSGPKGFGHWVYTVARGQTKGSNHKVVVGAVTVGLRKNYGTQTFFTIS